MDEDELSEEEEHDDEEWDTLILSRYRQFYSTKPFGQMIRINKSIWKGYLKEEIVKI